MMIKQVYRMVLGGLALLLVACASMSAPATPTASPSPSPGVTLIPSATRIPPTPEPTLPPEFQALKDTAVSWEVDLIEPDGSNLRRVSPQGVPCRYPHFSPDGRWLAFARVDDTPALMLYDRQSGAITSVAVPQEIGGIAWSGDSQYGAVVSDDWNMDTSTVMVYNLKTGKLNPILTWDGMISSVSWSKDGRHIALVGSHEKALSLAENRKWEVYVVNADGSGLRQLTHSEGTASSAEWSPVDDRLAVLQNKTVMLLRPDQPDRPAQTVGEVSIYAGWIIWSRDGRSIAVSGFPHTEIFDVETGVVRSVNGNSYLGQNAAFGWSMDGTKMLFEGSCCGVHWISFTDLGPDGTGHSVIDSHILGYNHFNQLEPDWAPDADLIAFSGIWQPLGP